MALLGSSWDGDAEGVIQALESGVCADVTLPVGHNYHMNKLRFYVETCCVCCHHLYTEGLLTLKYATVGCESVLVIVVWREKQDFFE